MGFFSNAWDVVKSAGKTVTRVVKKVYEVCTDDRAVEVYDRLESVIRNHSNQNRSDSGDAPDFYGVVDTSHIEKKLSEQNKKIVAQDSQLKESRKIMALQIELTRLRASADLIDRSMNNVKMHASSLSVHYQNMRNINGLIEEFNDLRHGLKAVISNINYNANIINTEGGKQRKIEGIDIEKKEGAISQVAAYDAFDRTRELLKNEVYELSNQSVKHLEDIDRLKVNASDLGGQLGRQIIQFVDEKIIPIIKKAELAGLTLQTEVAQLPAAVREQSGSLVFENGKIKLVDL